ncbi:MAG: PilZ domain-containing protein [Thermodesulfobacteriota bacterium]
MKETGKKTRKEGERQYFRIDDSLPFDYHHMSKQEYLLAKGHHKTSLVTHGEPTEVKGVDDPLLQHLQMLNRKLDFIIKHLSNEQNIGPLLAGTSESKIPSVQDVNVSAGGLRFTCDKAYKLGSILKVSVGFPPTPYSMFSFIGKVVRVKPSTVQSGEKVAYSIAIQFIEIDEREREEVLRYVFEAERVQLQGQGDSNLT